MNLLTKGSIERIKTQCWQNGHEAGHSVGYLQGAEDLLRTLLAKNVNVFDQDIETGSAHKIKIDSKNSTQIKRLLADLFSDEAISGKCYQTDRVISLKEAVRRLAKSQNNPKNTSTSKPTEDQHQS